MEVSSADGTRIAAVRSGTGGALVLVHGTGYDHTVWDQVLPLLARQRTVYALDRRGRGTSGDAEEYTLEREIEDVMAICDAIGEPVALLGHNFGGLLAMEAALRARKVSRLLVYEPWIIGSRVLKFGVVPRLQALADAGDSEALLTAFSREVERNAPDQLEVQRAAPIWQQRLASSGTIMRELRALQGYRFDAVPLRKLAIPALLLLGSRSVTSAGRQVWIAHEALPVSPIVTLMEEQHLAMCTAPEVFAREVLAFLGA